jgi:hypothetical protein
MVWKIVLNISLIISSLIISWVWLLWKFNYEIYNTKIDRNNVRTEKKIYNTKSIMKYTSLLKAINLKFTNDSINIKNKFLFKIFYKKCKLNL